MKTKSVKTENQTITQSRYHQIRKSGLQTILKLILLSALFALTVAPAVLPDVELPGVFGDNMVFQQGMKVPVWGTAESGEKVSVAIDGRSSTTKAGKEDIDKNANGRIPCTAADWPNGRLKIDNKAGKTWAAQQESLGRVVVPPSAWDSGGLVPNTTAHKAWKKAVRAAGRDTVSADIWREMHECAEAARANPLARYYLGLGDDGQPADGVMHQPSILWQDKRTKKWCKCRPDAMRIQGDYAILGDLKIPEVDVRPDDMGGGYTRHIFKTKLDWQAGFCCRGVHEATGLICDAFNLIAVHGKGRIHRVEHHCIDDTDADLDRDFLGSLTTGEAEIMAQLVLLEQCERLNWWPKESGQSHKASRPRYMRG